MDPIIEKTVGENGYNILRTIASKEMGFNRLLGQLRMNKRVFRKEWKRLKREGYIKKITQKSFGREVKLGPGRPEDPFGLTEKGTKHFTVIKELEDLGSNLFLRIASQQTTYEQYTQKRRDAYDQLGIPSPTAKERREESLNFFADRVRNLHPNTIMLFETLNEQPRCTVFIKPFYVVKREEGPPKRIVIEQTQHRGPSP